MQLEMFLNFDGRAREAAEFYAGVFESEVGEIVTYGDAPVEVAEADKDRVVYAGIKVGGKTLMLMDFPEGALLDIGNNVNPTVSLADKDEVRRIFEALAEGGRVEMPLEKTFYSELYGMVTDKFGVVWHVLHSGQK